MGVSRCTARIMDKITGKKRQCKAYAVNGTTKCHNHGGRSLRGIAHPNYKHGRYVKGEKQGAFADAYRAAMADTNSLKLHDEIAVLRARAFMLVDRAIENDPDTPDQWDKLSGFVADMKHAQAKGDAGALNNALNGIRDLVTGEDDSNATWNEVYNVIDRIGRLTTRERQRQIAYQSMVSVERAMEVFQGLLGIVRRHVTDAATLQKIATEAYPLIYSSADDQAAIDPVASVAISDGDDGKAS